MVFTKSPKKETIREFEEKGLGPLFIELENGKITSEEFLNRLDRVEKRSVIRVGRFFEKLLEVIFT